MLSELWHSSSAHCFALINVIQTCIEFGFTKCIHFTHIAPSNMNYLRCKIRQIHLHLSQKKIHILSAYFDKLCDSFWQLTMAYRSPPILSQPLATQIHFLALYPQCGFHIVAHLRWCCSCHRQLCCYSSLFLISFGRTFESPKNMSPVYSRHFSQLVVFCNFYI